MTLHPVEAWARETAKLEASWRKPPDACLRLAEIVTGIPAEYIPGNPSQDSDIVWARHVAIWAMWWAKMRPREIVRVMHCTTPLVYSVVKRMEARHGNNIAVIAKTFGREIGRKHVAAERRVAIARRFGRNRRAAAQGHPDDHGGT